jgi:hypothetical protein
MTSIVGAIIVVAGAVLIAAGIIAHDLSQHLASHSSAGYFLGGALGVIGFALVIAGPLKRGWDAIPVEQKTHP